MAPLSTDVQSRYTYRNVHYLLIRAYLRENRLAEASTALFRVLCEFPQDAGAAVLLAFLGGVCENPEITAVDVNREGLEYQDKLAEGLRILPETTRREAARGAAALLDEFLALERSVVGSEALQEDVRRLMSALIESNMRQALAAGQAELADTLRILNLTLSGQNRRLWED